MRKYIFITVLSIAFGATQAQHRTAGPETAINIDASGNKKAYFNIKTGSTVALADTASGWDISLQGTNIQLHSGLQAQVLNQYFKDVKTAPTSGYSNTISTSSLFQINGNVATVIAPRTVVLKYADNSYAKAEIVSYNQVLDHNLYGAQGYYTIRYYHASGTDLNKLATEVYNLFSGYQHYQFFNFASADTIPYTDSASKKWDIAFNTTNIILNSGTSGPDFDSTQILSQDFNTVTTAPLSGYHADNGDTKAIPGGSGSGWYTYDITVHSIKPTPNKTIIVKTGEGRFIKMRIDSYYKDAPANPNFLDINTARYYTFVYYYQPDGSNIFGNVQSPTLDVNEQNTVVGKLNISPNPANQQFSINWEKTAGLSTIRIINLQGAVVKELSTYDNHLLMEEALKPGLYIVSINSGFATSTSKLLVY